MTIGQDNAGFTGSPIIIPPFGVDEKSAKVSIYEGNSTSNRMDNNNIIAKEEQKRKEEEERKRKKKEDDWNIGDIQLDEGTPFSELTRPEQIKLVLTNIIKVAVTIGLLYLFVCSLDLLSSSFRLIAGKATTAVLSNKYVENPIVGLMIGILVTVLVQSSSTSTSIIVSMVAADILNVHIAVPMIMGSNIGTSVTNTIVSLTQVGNKDEFRRAFAGATVHDMFNWLAVTVLLIIEVITGMLEKITQLMVDSLDFGSGSDIKILKVITEPLTDLIIELDKTVLYCWGLQARLDKDSLVKQYCSYDYVELNQTQGLTNLTTIANNDVPEQCRDDPSKVGVEGSCHFLFYDTSMSDMQIGIILLVVSLATLCIALIVIVKILNSMLKGSIAVVIRKTLNSDIPYVPWLTGYVAILVGAVMTFIVQSSSIFTSTLTPLIGIGIISVERSYPLTLGSNLGTTTTALLASMAGEGESLKYSIQIALVHLFFNIFGILLFYPIPFMRFPIPMCKALGNITADYRWFAVVYLILMFFLLPAFVFVLSLGGPPVLWGVLGPILILAVFVIFVNLLQKKKPSWLPNKLKNWSFLPLFMRSLQPYDRVFTALPCCKSCRKTETELEEVVYSHQSSLSSRSTIASSNGRDNPIQVTDNTDL